MAIAMRSQKLEHTTAPTAPTRVRLMLAGVLAFLTFHPTLVVAGPVSRRALIAERRSLAACEDGNIAAGSLALLGTIIGAMVIITVVAAMVPSWFKSIKDTNTVLKDNNTTTGDATADGIVKVFPLVIGIVGALGIIGVIITAVTIKHRA